MRLTKPIARELALEAALFAAGAGEIALCHDRPVVLAVLLVGTAPLAFAIWRGRDVVWTYVAGGVIGPCGEMICVAAGAWAYADATPLGIPLWLPFGWALVAVLIRGVAGTVGKMTGG